MHTIHLLVRNREEMPPKVSISSVSEPDMTSQLIIGQTNVFLCVAEYNLSTTSPYQWQGWWQVNGVDQYGVINEDPFEICDPANNWVKIFFELVYRHQYNILKDPLSSSHISRLLESPRHFLFITPQQKNLNIHQPITGDF